MWPIGLYNTFPHFLKKAIFSKKKIIEHKMCVLISLQLLSETFFILRNGRDIIKNVYWFSCKVPIILVIFRKKTLIFVIDLRRILKIQIS